MTTRISDIIGEDYKTWRGRALDEDEFLALGDGSLSEDDTGDCITITADTGTGKTFFIFNILAKYAEDHINAKILYLCNRTALKSDAETYKEKFKVLNVTIMTYQELEWILMQKNRQYNNLFTDSDEIDYDSRTDFFKNKFKELGKYTYIVADECHYFFEDADFNDNTHFSYDFLCRETPQTRIFISATPMMLETFFKDLNTEVKSYNLKKDASYMDLFFFQDDIEYEKDFVRDEIQKILTEEPDAKILYFVPSLKRLSEFVNDNDFITVDPKGKEEKYDKGHVNTYIFYSESQKANTNLPLNKTCIKVFNDDLITFERPLLVTTSALSNGVTIKDRNLKYIFCDIPNIFTAIQCIGRKRVVDEYDKCKVYVRYSRSKDVIATRNYAKEQLRLSNLFIDEYETYASEVGSFGVKQADCLYVDWEKGGKLCINWTQYYKNILSFGVNASMILLNNVNSGEHESFGYRVCFKSNCGLESTSDSISYYPTKTDTEIIRQERIQEKIFEILAPALKICKEHIGERIYQDSSEYITLIAVKAQINEFLKNKTKPKPSCNTLQKYCDLIGKFSPYIGVHKRDRRLNEHEGKSYFLFRVS